MWRKVEGMIALLLLTFVLVLIGVFAAHITGTWWAMPAVIGAMVLATIVHPLFFIIAIFVAIVAAESLSPTRS